MKLFKYFFSFLLLLQCNCYAQDQHLIDSLENKLKQIETHKSEMHGKIPDAYNKERINILNDLSKLSINTGSFSKGVQYANIALSLSQHIKYNIGIITSYKNIGDIYFEQSYYLEALKNYLSAIKYSEQNEMPQIFSDVYTNIGIINIYQGNNSQAMQNMLSSLKINERFKNKSGIARNFINIGWCFSEQNNNEAALNKFVEGLNLAKQIGDKQNIALATNNIGFLYKQMGYYPKALQYLINALKMSQESGNAENTAEIYESIGETYFEMGKYAESINSLNAALKAPRAVSLKIGTESYAALAKVYEKLNDQQNAYKYYKHHIQYRDSLLNLETTKKLVQTQMQYEFDKKESLAKAEQEKKDVFAKAELQKQKVIKYSGFGGLLLVLLFAFALYKRFSEKRKANIVLEITLQNLKDTQTQLVKSEKMAAFGVMAKRVAHEIQNPLNFVNNFSEISEEMVQEIFDSNNPDEKNEIAKRLLINVQKINQHGKNASSIVKQLQQHSRAGTAHEFFEDDKIK